MTTKLYTAAEARRIDIERGGHGRIVRRGDRYFHFFKEDQKLWGNGEDLDGHVCYSLSHERPELFIKQIWLPLTPKPELDGEEEHLLKIQQLQKELAEAKNHYSKLFSENHTLIFEKDDLQKKLAWATNNYHELLADHGELTQKFDELTEKARRIYERL